MSIHRKKKLADNSGKVIEEIRLLNNRGTEVCCTNYGCIISAFRVKGINIVLGFDDIMDYLSSEYKSNYPYMGCIAGRFANRIAGGSFRIDGTEYHVSKNTGNDHLHGGFEGFDKKTWDIESVSENPIPAITFRYISKDGEEGFPGNVTVFVTYSLSDADELIFECKATADKPTTINLTQHSYFNLNGNGNILQHSLMINADTYLAQDANLVATGESLPVGETIYDFRQWKKINDDMDEQVGYDQTFEIDKKNGLTMAARAKGDKTGLCLQVMTTEPAVHLYTGKGIPSFERNGKKLFGAYSGFCLETQKHPNAINVSHFPNTVLRPGEIYFAKTVFRITQEPEK